MSDDGPRRSLRSKEFRDTDGRTLPERIRHRRTARGMRSNELAGSLGVSPAYVTMIERGKKVPGEDVAVAIARLLNDDPELYRAWVHSTRFTDPQSTLRGLQQLNYRASNPRGRSANARIQAASTRARRMQDSQASTRLSARPQGDLERLVSRLVSPFGSVEARNEAAPDTPLVALGGVAGRRVTFWRLPWALLVSDLRPRRFLVCPGLQEDTLIVVTPEQFLEVVMQPDEPGEQPDPMGSRVWQGWSDDPEVEARGGGYTQPLDLRGRFAPFVRDKRRFLESLGDPVDVILHEGTGVSIQQLPLARFLEMLEHHDGA